ncbi:MAG: PAS domain S-box protein [Candidatus Omnitrophota bacterium]
MKNSFKIERGRRTLFLGLAAFSYEAFLPHVCFGSAGEFIELVSDNAFIYGLLIVVFAAALIFIVGRLLGDSFDADSESQDTSKKRKSDINIKKEILDAFYDGLWIIGDTGKTTLASRALSRISGLNTENLEEKGIDGWLEVVHPADKEKVTTAYKDLFEEKKLFDMEYRIKHSGGQLRWLRDRALINYEEGGSFYAAGTRSDITSFKLQDQVYKRQNERLNSEIKNLSAELEKLNKNFAGEVAERSSVQRGLKDLGESFRSIFEEAPIGMAVVNLDYKIIKANKYLCEILGYTQDELTKLTLRDITHPDDFGKGAHSAELISKGAVSGYTLKKRCLTKSKNSLWVNETATLISDSQEKNMHAVVMFEDITRSMAAEDALSREKSMAQEYLDVASVIIVAIDNNGMVTSINKKGCEILEYSHDEIVGKNWFDSFVPPRIKKEILDVSRTIKGGKLASFEYYENPVLTKSGKEIIIAWHNAVLRSSQGGITGHLSSGQDITERRAAEESLKISRQQYITTLDSMGDAIHVVDRDLRIALINASFKSWILKLGIKYNVAGMNVFEAFPFLSQKVRREYNQVFETGEILITEEENQVGGKTICTETRKIPVFKYGEVVQVTTVLRDITERKNLEILRQEFASTVSHELRTPLMITDEGIKSVIDGVRGPLSQEQKEVLGATSQNISRLVRVINNLLDTAKVESGKMEVYLKKADLCAVVKQIVSIFDPFIKDKAIKISVNMPAEGIEADFDIDKVTQILTNLLDNALKFTERGSIDIYVESKEETVECSVVDSGCGIHTDDIPFLFDKFSQLRHMPGFGRMGVGLGLYIIKKLIELHGGHIRVESEINKGTRFTFILPKNQPGREGTAQDRK